MIGDLRLVKKSPRSQIFILSVLFVLTGLQPSLAKESLRRNAVVVAVEQVSSSVVNISTIQRESVSPLFPFLDDDFFKDFFPGMSPREYTRTSLGSGVIIDGKNGYIITNQHVVARATDIKIITSTEEEFHARIVGSDPRSDLAVLQVKAPKKLPEIAMGDSDNLMIGETVIAIGNPIGLSHTVTTGVISALDRTVRAGDRIYRQFIQTDASINPGNSGGPLLNIDGELIGINSAIYQKAQGIGFAIPINKARSIVRELIREGVVQVPWLGLELQELTTALKSHFGLAEGDKGVLVSDLTKGGPADRAGVKRGDVIQKIGEFPVSSMPEYQDVLSEFTPSDLINLTIVRNGKLTNLSAKASVFPLDQALELTEQKLGIRVGAAEKKKLQQYGLEEGVMIQKVRKGSEAGRIGLEPGDLILKINDTQTMNLDEFKRAISRYHYLPSLTLIVRRGPYNYSLALPF